MARPATDNLYEAIRQNDGLRLYSHIDRKRPSANEVGVTPLISDELREQINLGWKATWSFLFDDPRKPLVSRFARHHRDSVKWHWTARHRLCRLAVAKQILESQLAASVLTELEFNLATAKAEIDNRPRYLADFPMWSRGHMKSTIARRIAVIDAVISLYYGLTGYCLYFSGTQDKTDKHSVSIEKLLRNAKMREHAPLLTQVNRSEEGSRQLGWKATMFYTAAGYVFHFGSLQSGLAGGNIADLRPTLLIPDDIDDRSDSAVEAENNFNLLTTEILPMGTKGTLTFWAQNLINRMSCMYRIYKGHARVLTNRRPSKPVPAIAGCTGCPSRRPETGGCPIHDFRTEVRTVDGTPRDIIVSGTPTWEWFDRDACQEELNRIGLPAFERECQHNVEHSIEGLIAYNYDDAVHVISKSEFASVYGAFESCKTWAKWIFHDYARTKTKFHANVAGYVTVSSQNTPLPGFQFVIHPMSFPPNTGGEDVAERILSVLEEKAPARVPNQPQKTWAELRQDTLHRQNIPEHLSTVRDQLDFERKVLAEIIPIYSRPVLHSWNVLGGVMSHSEDTLRALYRKVYGIQLTASNPGMFDGVEDINRAMLVDRAVAHPFRPGQMGYTRWFIVVPDDTDDSHPRIDERTGKKIYRPVPYRHELKPDELHDHDLIRYQLCNWRTAAPQLTRAGEKIDVVEKLNDDFGQALQMLYFKKLLANVPLPKSQLVEEHMPHSLKVATIEAIVDDTQRANTLQGRLMRIKEVERELTRPALNPGIRRIRRK